MKNLDAYLIITMLILAACVSVLLSPIFLFGSDDECDLRFGGDV